MFIRQLDYLVTLAREKHFAKAADIGFSYVISTGNEAGHVDFSMQTATESNTLLHHWNRWPDDDIKNYKLYN